jgi:hypothetical protein
MPCGQWYLGLHPTGVRMAERPEGRQGGGLRISVSLRES